MDPVSAPVLNPVETAPVKTDPVKTPQTTQQRDTPWITLVWNDPVNLMSYVTLVFRRLFGYNLQKATSLMLDVHHKGRAVVSSGSREQMEHDVARLHAAGLWATLQQDQ